MKNNAPVATQASPALVNPFEHSIGKLLVIAFPKSTSKNLPMAVTLAERSESFLMANIGEIPMHIAGFMANERDIRIALALLDFVSGWKGTLIFSNGLLVKSHYEITEVLNCYLQSCLCKDPRAHCFVLVDDPEFTPTRRSFSFSIAIGETTTKRVTVKRYTFPCAFLHRSMKFQVGHPSNFQDQIQAAGVRANCHLCPRFDPEQFKESGSEECEVDL